MSDVECITSYMQVNTLREDVKPWRVCIDTASALNAGHLHFEMLWSFHFTQFNTLNVVLQIRSATKRWKSDFTGSWIDVLHGVLPVQELMYWFVLCPPRVDAVQSNHSTCMQQSPDDPQHSPMPWLSSPLDCPTPCQSSNINWAFTEVGEMKIITKIDNKDSTTHMGSRNGKTG